MESAGEHRLGSLYEIMARTRLRLVVRKAFVRTEQLCVSEQQFWECVSNKNAPKRGSGSDKTPVGALPAQLVHQLIHDLGVPEDEIVGMTLEHAAKLMVAYWSKPRG